MSAIATTKMSSKGQVVIPEAVRKKLHLQPGAQFVVIASDDAIILKTITPPSMEEFDALLAEVRSQARRARMKRGDVVEAIEAERRR